MKNTADQASVWVVASSTPSTNADAGQQEADARQRIGRRHHPAPPEAIEQRAEQQRSEHVAGRERQDVQADARRLDAVEAGQHQRVGEEDRVVEERLRDHQREDQHAAPRIATQQHVRHLAERRQPRRRMGARARRHRGERQPLAPHACLDVGDDALGLVDPAAREQPARALRHFAAHPQDGERQGGAEQEADAPALMRPEHARIEQHEAQQRTDRGADPEAAVDREVDPAAHARRDQLVDRRIDRRVLAADADAGDQADTPRSHAKSVENAVATVARHVDREGREEQALAAEAVGEPSEDERADHRAADIERAGPADLRRGESERIGMFERAADRADDRHLEAVEHPGDAERDDDAPVPARPRQSVEARWDVAVDRHAVHCRSTAARRPARG